MTKSIPKVSNYIASHTTYFLKSISHHERIYTLVADKHGRVIYPYKPIKIIRNTCKLHGSTYQASQLQAKQFFGKNKHKLPILISYDFGDPCIFFPLFSPSSPHNIWIAFQSIVNIVEHKEETIVTFIDGSEEYLPLHCKSFNHQYVRASMFYKHLILKRNSTL